MIPSPNHSARTGAPVRLVVLHTAEGARDRTSLGRYFQGDVGASSHVGIDAAGIEQYVDYSRYAWTLLNGNPISDNAELCAFARWTRDQWMSTSPVDGCANPKGILDNAAKWVAERCKARGIPIRKLTPAQVDQGMSGVIGHADWTYSNVGQGDHTDPESGHYGKGTGFPWDYVIARAAGTQEGEDDMTPDELLNATVRVEGDVVNAGKDISLRTIFAWSDNNFADLGKRIDAVDAKVSQGGAAIDYDTLAAKVADRVGDAVADKVADRLAKRLES